MFRWNVTTVCELLCRYLLFLLICVVTAIKSNGVMLLLPMQAALIPIPEHGASPFYAEYRLRAKSGCIKNTAFRFVFE